MIGCDGSDRLLCVLPQIVLDGIRTRPCIKSIGVCREYLHPLGHGCGNCLPDTRFLPD
jgi:hypothetical protein